MPRTRSNFALACLTACALAAPAAAAQLRPGFDGRTLPTTDDGSTAAVPLGFTINFYGRSHSLAYINNNGNITLDSPLSNYTAFDLRGTEREVIAPFFADVDTSAAGRVVYGSGTVNGRAAFAVSWLDVGYYPAATDRRNSFQLVVIDRADTGAGNFDLEFNYEQIQWESGGSSGGTDGLGGDAARAGWSNGTRQPGTFFELPGSGVNGAFLDSNPAKGLIYNSYSSGDPGRYLFQARNGHLSCDMPEPSTLLLAGLGAALVVGHRWGRRRIVSRRLLTSPGKGVSVG
jgi:hypothetical protein